MNQMNHEKGKLNVKTRKSRVSMKKTKAMNPKDHIVI